MQTGLGHLQLNVAPANLPFYKDLMTFVGWRILDDSEGSLGVAGKSGTSLWFVGEVNGARNDYDGPGMNHLALSAQAQADVDAVATYLNERNIERLFETPRHRPDFAANDDQTYYQVMFETPDRILIEVVYTGPKSA